MGIDRSRVKQQQFGEMVQMKCVCVCVFLSVK